MGASAQPERPSIEDILKRARARPTIESLITGSAPTPSPAPTAPEQPAPVPYSEQVNRRLLALTDFLPGAHAVIAGGRAALDKNTTYADEARGIGESMEAYNADPDETWRRRGLKLAGGYVAGAGAGKLLKSVAGQAALVGAAGAALDESPDMSLGERAVGTGLGAASGALLGKGLEVAATGIQSLLRMRPGAVLPSSRPRPMRELTQMSLERAQAAKELYGRARAEGDQNAIGQATKALDDFLNEPRIAEIVDDIQQVREFRGMDRRDPKVLDAVIKELSDRAGQISKGQAAVNPSRPNTGRIRAQEVRGLSDQGLDAVSGPGGPMPTYIEAVRDFSFRSKLMDAYSRGYEASRSEANVGLPSLNSMKKNAPETLASWLDKNKRGMAPEQVALLERAARDGVLGASKEALARMSLIRPLWSLAQTQTMAEAPQVLRASGIQRPAPRRLFDVLSATTAGMAGNRVGGLLDR